MGTEELQRQGFDLSAEGEGGSIDVRCSQCEALVINGVPCHERGCPNTPHECRECGQLHATRQEAAECCGEFWDEHYSDDAEDDT